jgi:Flp pilus assembly pilin Flp
MKRPGNPVRFIRDQAGVAAIEMALIFPVMMILFVGMIDVTTLLSDNRRVSHSATVVADVVTRLQNPTTPEEIIDSFKAAELMMRAAQAGPARVEIYNYEWNNGNPALRWQRGNDVDQDRDCGAPDTGSILDLMGSENDVVVAVVCVTHLPVVGNVLGWTPVGAATFELRQQIAMRPRQSLTLECPLC